GEPAQLERNGRRRLRVRDRRRQGARGGGGREGASEKRTTRERRNQQADLVVHGVSPLARSSGAGILLRHAGRGLCRGNVRGRGRTWPTPGRRFRASAAWAELPHSQPEPRRVSRERTRHWGQNRHACGVGCRALHWPTSEVSSPALNVAGRNGVSVTPVGK